MLEHPAANLQRWDKRGARAAIAGYFSADAHLYYRGIFALLRLHVLVDGPSGTAGGGDPADADAEGAAVWRSLHRGRFYNAVEAVADASGFRFEALEEKDEGSAGAASGDPAGHRRRSYGMGDTIAIATAAPMKIRFRALMPSRFRKEIRLLRDGRVMAATRGSGLDVPAEGPGVYRVEVYLKERTPLRADIPWIVSNPIYLRKE